ncbi:MAG: hypothetical protein ACE15C_03515 [Phycisphaerae bacterium]
MRTAHGILMMTLLAVLPALCGCGVGPFDVTVTFDPSFRDSAGQVPSVEVHIFAANDTEKEVWNTMSMTNYWKPGSKERESAKDSVYVMKFGQGLPAEQVLKEEDPQWDRWLAKGPRTLFVMAYLPGVLDDRPGSADPRRLVLPMEKLKWKDYIWGRKYQQIKVLVKPGGLVCLTPPERK